MSRGDRLGLGLVGVVFLCALAWMALVTLGEGDSEANQPEESPVREEAQATRPPTDTRATEPVKVAVLEAASRAGARWSELNSEAIEALNAGRLEQAVKLLEQCLAGEPEEPVFAANLAEALARLARELYAESGDLERPIELLERAIELAPARADLVELLARWKKIVAAERGFWTDETTHFLLSYDGDRGDILNHGHDVLTSALEQAYAEFAVQFNHQPVPVGEPKIKVVLYAREEFSELTGIGHWAGGVYDGVVRIPIVNFASERATLVRVMRHELIHAFLQSLGGGHVPAWLNEGLAQWHEHEQPSRRTAAVERARAKLVGHELFPLEKLRGTLATWQDPEEIARGYAQALALMAYIEQWYGDRVLYEMVEGCARGASSEQTFAARIGVQLSVVLQDLGAGL